jgi:hypothetical protein
MDLGRQRHASHLPAFRLAYHQHSVLHMIPPRAHELSLRVTLHHEHLDRSILNAKIGNVNAEIGIVNT